MVIQTTSLPPFALRTFAFVIEWSLVNGSDLAGILFGPPLLLLFRIPLTSHRAFGPLGFLLFDILEAWLRRGGPQSTIRFHSTASLASEYRSAMSKSSDTVLGGLMLRSSVNLRYLSAYLKARITESSEIFGMVLRTSMKCFTN